jgi:hypothetical protein
MLELADCSSFDIELVLIPSAQEYPEKRLFIPFLASHLLRSDFSHLFRQLQRFGILKTPLDINHVPVEITPVV